MRRSWAREIGLAAFVLLLQSVPFLFSAPRPGGAWTVAEYAPIAATALPLLWRRRAPLTCLILIVFGIEAYAFLGRNGPPQPIWYGGLIAIYTIGAHAGRIQRIVAVAIIPIGVIIAVGSISTGVRETLTWGAVFALGVMMRTRREFAAESARHSIELAAERERTRIARDLHDILGHAFSVMVVQAEAGAMTAEPNSRAQTAFRAISDTGREAMAQLRATVGTLRTRGPSLADLQDLVSRAETSGMRVALAVRGQPRPLPAEVQLAGYRVVQEALTNSIKHSGATNVEVTVQWHPEEVRLSVIDDGTGPGARFGAAGSGLAGMIARAAEVGATVSYGPRKGARGFAVEAVLT
ncbi:sensor histidine kinase [Micromonospora eburnea]|uniref:histidine kinase n=1 Tax=Micromonospora eburnea TaxID=227316 RepID=A0A1C6V2T5_9ACTN|nr:histidine kinase [Micromonospora eburnea]SCL60606.1 Signal transduction histidine kinase [Micromonospora eburnea]